MLLDSVDEDEDPTAWDDDINKDDLKMPATKGVLKSGKDRKPSTPKRATGLSARNNKERESMATMTHMVLEMKEAMKDLAVSMKDMRKTLQGKTKREAGTAGGKPKSDSGETSDNTGDLVGALREMTEDWRFDWTSDRPQKDSLWKAASRTSLLTIKTEEGLQERLNKLASLVLPEEMFENQAHKFSAIFSKLHWGPERVHAWLCCNWFLRIGKDTLDNYVALHLHLVTLSNNESWTYAHESLKHYASKLAQFCKTSTSRLLCLFKIYIFL
jgi:hypothetical protein